MDIAGVLTCFCGAGRFASVLAQPLFLAAAKLSALSVQQVQSPEWRRFWRAVPVSTLVSPLLRCLSLWSWSQTPLGRTSALSCIGGAVTPAVAVSSTLHELFGVLVALRE